MQQINFTVQGDCMTYGKASKRFSIPKTTLYRYNKENKKCSLIKLKKMGNPPVLSADEERDLSNYISQVIILKAILDIIL